MAGLPDDVSLEWLTGTGSGKIPGDITFHPHLENQELKIEGKFEIPKTIFNKNKKGKTAYGYKSSSEEYSISHHFYECLKELVELNIHVWTQKFLCQHRYANQQALPRLLQAAFYGNDEWECVLGMIQLEEGCLKDGTVMEGSRLGQKPEKFHGIKSSTMLHLFKTYNGILKLIETLNCREGTSNFSELENRYRQKSHNFYQIPPQCSLMEYMVHAFKRRSTLFEPNTELVSKNGLAPLSLKLPVVLGSHSELVPLKWLGDMLADWSQIKGINYHYNISHDQIRTKAINLAKNEQSLRQTMSSGDGNIDWNSIDFFGMSDEEFQKMINKNLHGTGGTHPQVHQSRFVEMQTDEKEEKEISNPRDHRRARSRSQLFPTNPFLTSNHQDNNRELKFNLRSESGLTMELEKENAILHQTVKRVKQEKVQLEQNFEYFNRERFEMEGLIDRLREEISNLHTSLKLRESKEKENENINLSNLSDAELGKLQKQIVEEREDRLRCVVCMDRRSCVLTLPCRHQRTCQQCSSALKACPLCRAPIESQIVPFR